MIAFLRWLQDATLGSDQCRSVCIPQPATAFLCAARTIYCSLPHGTLFALFSTYSSDTYLNGLLSIKGRPRVLSPIVILSLEKTCVHSF